MARSHVGALLDICKKMVTTLFSVAVFFALSTNFAMAQVATANDKVLASDLQSRGYSSEEAKLVVAILVNSKQSSKELGLIKPISTITFNLFNNGLKDRLGIINTNVGNLATLESKNIRDILGTEKVTPENITQVLTTLHTINPEEASKMYG